MNSIIKPWQKNRPSTLIRTDSDPKPAIYYLSKSGQVASIVVHLWKVLEKSVGRKNGQKMVEKIGSVIN